MAKIDTTQYTTYEDISKRLEEIEKDVKSKDISLERSLDLFDEAIALSSKAVELVDKTNFSEEESQKIDEKSSIGKEEDSSSKE